LEFEHYLLRRVWPNYLRHWSSPRRDHQRNISISINNSFDQELFLKVSSETYLRAILHTVECLNSGEDGTIELWSNVTKTKNENENCGLIDQRKRKRRTISVGLRMSQFQLIKNCFRRSRLRLT